MSRTFTLKKIEHGMLKHFSVDSLGTESGLMNVAPAQTKLEGAAGHAEPVKCLKWLSGILKHPINAGKKEFLRKI